MIVTIGIDTPGHVPETICPTLISILFDDDLPAETIYDNAQLLGRLLRVAPFRALLPAVWKRLDCVEMTFANGGNSASSTAGFMRGYVHELSERAGHLTVDDARLPFAVDTLPDLLQRMRVNEAPIYRGRSACYSLPDGERTLVVKYAHLNQSGHELGRELKWLDCLAAADIPLRSFLPTPVRDPSDRPVLWRDGARTAIAFIAHRSYYRYPNDDGVTDAEFFEGIADAMHDIFLLARYGVYHTAPIAAFHNGEPGALHRSNGDHGRYTIFPDAAFDWDTRGGLGRLDDWPKALRFPNIGVFGMRDCEELATLSEIITDGERWAPQLRSLGDKLSNNMFYEVCLLGMAPFAAALLVGERIARQADPAWLRTLITRADRPDPPLERYAKWLLHFFAEAYAGRHGFHVHHAKAVLEARADWVRLARQLAFFMTPTYVPFVRQGQPAHQFPEAAIYGRSVLKRRAMGTYRPGTFDHERGFIGPSGDPTQLALGPVNGPFPIAELEKAIFALFW